LKEDIYILVKKDIFISALTKKEKMLDLSIWLVIIGRFLFLEVKK